MFICSDCGGWGEIEIAYSDMTGGYTDDRTVTCERCLGSGRSWADYPSIKGLLYSVHFWLKMGFSRCPDPDCGEWERIAWLNVGEHHDCIPF